MNNTEWTQKISNRKIGITTYLLGAGASANSLPIVNNYSARFNEFIQFLSSIKNKEGDSNKKSRFEIVCKDFEWLIKKTKNTSTDAFAFTLFQNDQIDELIKIKKILTFFFIIEQFRHPIDKRYLSFLNKIWPGKRSNLPSDRIRILNWNYDFQIEMALVKLAHFSNSFTPSDIQRQCLPSTLPLYDMSIQSNYFNNVSADKFSIFHLNGICYCHEYDSHKVHLRQATTVPLPFNHIYNPFDLNKKDIIEIVNSQIFNYLDLLNRKGHTTAIKFAWENPEYDRPPYNIRNKVFEKALDAISDSENLVIIGYSFPDFNFRADRLLISAIKNLKKIYFQDLHSTAIKERFFLHFPEFKDLKFDTINNCDDFLALDI